MMRLTLALTALGLTITHVTGQQHERQQQWQDFGAMPDQMKQSFYDAMARPASLAKRDGSCPEGRHPCSDLNSTLCCSNTDYCVINDTDTSLRVQCCELGSTCGFVCGTESYYTLVTITSTTTSARGATTITSTETAGACVGRRCSGNKYRCPESMGGECCAYGQDCASSGLCLDFGGATTTSGGGTALGPTVATMIPSGCSQQGDSTCSVGGAGAVATTTGCCGAGYTCAVDSDSRAVCSPASSSTTTGLAPTGSGISVVRQGQGLSTGAKAGIAVGVVVVSAVIIGAATWFCLRRRRRSPAARSTTTGNEMGSGIGGAGGGGPLPGLGRDYFGPVTASGPYTTPPEYPNRQYYGGGGADDPARPVRGDGATPHGPDDIASAVEIGGGRSEDSLVARQKSGTKGAVRTGMGKGEVS